MKVIKSLSFSIIVSVYNAENTLERCLESLVSQTYNDVKIIVVDKESTDASSKIERFYEKHFPEKVYIYNRPYTDNAAAGRNYGIQMASTEYVAFCDADDYMDITAIEVLNNYIMQSKVDYDLVCYGTYLTKNGDITSADMYQKPLKKETLLMGKNCMGFWNKLIKRSLLLECGDIFDSLFDDIGYIPIVISKAKKIGCVNRPLYFFEQEGGASHRSGSPKCLELLKSLEHVFSCILARDLAAFSVCAATRVVNNIKSNPNYEDVFIQWLQKNRAYFVANSILKTQKSVYQQIMGFIEGYNIWIPKTIYINGFINIDKSWLQQVKSLTFYGNDMSIMILNASNCEIESDPYAAEAFKRKEYEFLGEWFALKKIYSSGGFYISNKLQVTQHFGELRKYDAILGQLYPGSYSGDIIGGCAGSALIKFILDTYCEGFYGHSYMRLNERIDNIMSCVYDIPADGYQHVKSNIYVAPLCKLTINIGNGENLCAYQSYNDNDNQAITIDARILNLMLEQCESGECKQINSRYLKVQEELQRIKNSDSYRLSIWLKKIGDTRIGYFPKRLMKLLIRKYRQIRHHA